MISLQEENKLIDRILAGKQEPYARLVENYQRFAFTIALKILNNRPEAEEATQDAFIKAFHYLKNFNRKARFSTWLYRIVFNTAVSYKRKNRPVLSSIEHHVAAITSDCPKRAFQPCHPGTCQTPQVSSNIFYPISQERFYPCQM